MNVPTSFEPRTSGERTLLTVREPRNWAVWVLAGLSVGAGMLAVALATDVPGAALMFALLSGALGYGWYAFYTGQTLSTELDVGGGAIRVNGSSIATAELETVEVLGSAQQTLMFRWAEGQSTMIQAGAHSAEDVQALAEALRQLCGS